jgi:prevent-host-death family protein
MDHIIGVKELREHLEKYEKRVKRGQSFIVMKRSRPVFKISPVENDEGWETVIDFTKFRKQGIPINELIKRLKKIA